MDCGNDSQLMAASEHSSNVAEFFEIHDRFRSEAHIPFCLRNNQSNDKL